MHNFQIRHDRRQSSDKTATRIEWAREMLSTIYEYTNTRRDKAYEKGLTFTDDGFEQNYETLNRDQEDFEAKLGSPSTRHLFGWMKITKSRDTNEDLNQHIEKLLAFWDHVKPLWVELDLRLRQSTPSPGLQSTVSLPVSVGEAAARGTDTQPLPVPPPQPATQRTQSAPLLFLPTPSDAASVFTENSIDEPQSTAPLSPISSTTTLVPMSVRSADSNVARVGTPSSVYRNAPNTPLSSTTRTVPPSTASDARSHHEENGTQSFNKSRQIGNTYQFGGSNNIGGDARVVHDGERTTYHTQSPLAKERSPSQVEPQVEEISTPGMNNNHGAQHTDSGRTVSGNNNLVERDGVSNIQGNGNVVGFDFRSWMAANSSSTSEGNTIQFGGSGNRGGSFQVTAR